MKTHPTILAIVRNLILGVASFSLAGFAGAATQTLNINSDLTPQVVSNDPSGTLLDSTSNTFSNNSTYGTIYSWVVGNDSNNPYGSGGLDFIYQIANGSGAHSLERVVLSSFAGASTSVGYSTSSLSSLLTGAQTVNGNIPYHTDRDVAPGEGVGWGWSVDANGVLAGGTNSPFMVVYTDYGHYGSGHASLIDTYDAGASVLAPIPEPESIAMLITGLGLMGFIARRRKRALGA